MANKRAYSLTLDPNITFDAVIPTDKSGYAESKGVQLDTLLRTKVVNEIDDSGNASGTLNYTDYNLINLTIDQDYGALITGLESHEVVLLRVDKGSTDVFSVTNPTADFKRPESVQKGLTVLFYAIYNITSADAGDTITLVEPLINQLSDSAITITADDGTVTLTNYTESVVNDNVCHFEFSFTFQANTLGALHTFTLTNWNVTKEQVLQSACSLFLTQSGTNYGGAAKINTTDLTIQVSSSIAASTTTSVLVSGTFKVE